MSSQRAILWSVEWSAPAGLLRVDEPTREELASVAERLAGHYNEPYNRSMLAHSNDMSRADVMEYYDSLWEAGDRPFLLYRDARMIGDADLRHVEGPVAEFAIMVGERSIQGKGLGTSFGMMTHALAFRHLGFERLYITIVPANAASLRLFEKLGYEVDNSPAARVYIDDEADVSLSLTRERFESLHAPRLGELRSSSRG